MIPLESTLDPLSFESWIQIAALFIIVSGGITWKWLSTVGEKQKETGETVDEIKKTLTTNNGGSHIKDQLDRIEEVQLEQAKLMAADSQKLSDHMEWSAEYVRNTEGRLDGLYCQQRVGQVAGHRFVDEFDQTEPIG